MKKELGRILVFLVVAVMLCAFAGCEDKDIDEVQGTEKESIAVTNELPRVGPYSQMVRADGFVFCSAQAAFDPTTGKLVEGDITAQTTQIFNNFAAELADAGLTLDDTVSATVYLTDMSLFEEMNEVYATFFSEPYPARSCVEVSALPVEGALLTIQITVADK